MSGQGTIETAKKYYNSREADEFYHAIWGGEDIHVGIYETEHEAIATASRRTVETMLARIPVPHAEHHVLDIGSGYGGAARQIASVSDCKITCLNLSEVQNARNIEKNRAAPSQKLIDKYREEWGVDLYVLAWCQNGDLETLPEPMRQAAAALAEGWQQQVERFSQTGPSSDSP